jgi:hypothetical protein
MEAMIKSGAMDELGERGILLANMEEMLEYNRENTKQSKNQISLFGGIENVKLPEFKLKIAEKANQKEKLFWEKELLGLYISGHPFKKFEENLKAKKIIAVIPWMGYSPQDKEFRKGEPVSVQVIAKIIEAVGIDSLITLDIHSKNSLSFFHCPTHHLSAFDLFVDYLKTTDLTKKVVVSVDKGAQEQSKLLSKTLSLPLCVFEKSRNRATGAIKLKHISGKVKGKSAIAIERDTGWPARGKDRAWIRGPSARPCARRAAQRRARSTGETATRASTSAEPDFASFLYPLPRLSAATARKSLDRSCAAA